ncbi:MAG: hypothetical protein OdinLCB4_006705 [Candidatus Odinarchaeum yellowstonii]|uniref:Uncharacterized protein n=1 Tax=Odinarchaeota yellowstonii (strain LCB_4) TaxID=1841599 RepID=A0AAF0D1X8_ODILC|nr:MAG: hypothetical protein OdinLCB4_006705 [Candidatus Odinarchaeum yellowstonii]
MEAALKTVEKCIDYASRVLAAVYGMEKFVKFDKTTSKVEFIEKIIDMIVESYVNFKDLMELTLKLSELRARAAERFREYVLFLKNVVEKNISVELIPHFSGKALTSLEECEEYLREAREVIGKLRRPELKNVKKEFIELLGSDYKVFEERFLEEEKRIKELKKIFTPLIKDKS